MHRRRDAWRPRFGTTPVPQVPPIRPIPPIRPAQPPISGPPVSNPGQSQWQSRWQAEWQSQWRQEYQRHVRPHLRPPAYRSHRRRGAWTVARRMPPPLLILLGVVGVGLMIALVTALASIALVVGLIAVPVLITRGAIRARGRQRRLLAAAAHPVPPHVLARRPQLDPLAAWRHARSRFVAVRSEYAAYECDALAVLRLPALADVTVPSTARFIEAFAEAQALDTDSPQPSPHRERYVAAVERACQAWAAAREAAERIRLSHLPEEERATVERVVRLLTKARDTDSDAERLVAYGKARSDLAKLERTGRLRIPKAAQAQLDNAYRGQLPA